ncbi:MAG TPA: hypothetical protein VLK33_12895 [Terriglobales bacterium]|nr:hypothetical protein [Terriglobales bacterium]
MKASKIYVLLAMAVLFATSAFAANKTSIYLTKDAVVGGKTLPAGRYTVTWEGQGQNLDLSIAKGKEVVVKTPARMSDLPQPAANNAVVTKDVNGMTSLSEIQISGKKFSLELGEPNVQTDVASRAK